MSLAAVVADVTATPTASGREAGRAPGPQRAPASPVPPAAAASESVSPTTEQVRAVAQRLDAFLRSMGHQLRFHVDDASGRIVVSVVDAETGERIRQIPSEEMMRLARHGAPGDGAVSSLVNLEV